MTYEVRGTVVTPNKRGLYLRLGEITLAVPVDAAQDPEPFPAAPSPVGEEAPAAAMMEAEAAVAGAGLMPPAAPQQPTVAAQPATTPPTPLTPLRGIRTLELNTHVNVVAAAFSVGPLQTRDRRMFRIVELVDESWGTPTPLTLWGDLAERVGAALAAEHGKLAARPGAPAPVIVALDLCVTSNKARGGGPGGRALCSIASSRVIFKKGADFDDLGPDVISRASLMRARMLLGLAGGRTRPPSPSPSPSPAPSA